MLMYVYKVNYVYRWQLKSINSQDFSEMFLYNVPIRLQRVPAFLSTLQTLTEFELYIEWTDSYKWEKYH